MTAASLSMDLRQRIVGACECGNVSCRAVAARFGVAASTVGKLVQQSSTTVVYQGLVCGEPLVLKWHLIACA